MSHLEHKKYSPACDRNKDPILNVLRKNFPKNCKILEIASGTGQHADFFTSQESEWFWQSSDMNQDCLKSIEAYRLGARRKNFLSSLNLSTSDKSWNIGKFEGALCCNMIHISDWSSSVGLFEKLKNHLFPKSKLLLYGPFIQEGVETSVSNINFNITLKKTNPDWGIRRLKDINLLAKKTGFQQTNIFEMPANNIIVVFTLN